MLSVTSAFLPYEDDRDTRSFGRIGESTLAALPLPPATYMGNFAEMMVEEQSSPTKERRQSSLDWGFRRSSYSFDSDAPLDSSRTGSAATSSNDGFGEADSVLAMATGGKDKGTAHLEDDFVRRLSTSTPLGRTSSIVQRWNMFAVHLDKWISSLMTLFGQVTDTNKEDYVKYLRQQISTVQEDVKRWLREHKQDDTAAESCPLCVAETSDGNDEFLSEFCRSRLVRSRQRCVQLRQHCYYYQRLLASYEITESLLPANT